MHRYPALATRRRGVPARPPLAALDKAQQRLAREEHAGAETVARSRLWLAVAFWALRADINGKLPPGLDLYAFPATASGGSRFVDGRHPQVHLGCAVPMPLPVLLPALDGLYRAYDAARAELWPSFDRVVLLEGGDATERRTHKVARKRAGVDAAGRTTRIDVYEDVADAFMHARAAWECHALLSRTRRCIEGVLAQDVLAKMKPEQLREWTLQLTHEKVRRMDRSHERVGMWH